MKRSSRQMDIDDLDRILQLDATSIQNVRRDIVDASKFEVGKARKDLSDVKKEYDGLYASNMLKEKELASLRDEIKSREVLMDSNRTTELSLITKIKEQNNRQSKIIERISAEQRTMKMLNHMVTRMEREIAALTIEIQTKAVHKDSLTLDCKALQDTVRLGEAQFTSHMSIEFLCLLNYSLR